MQKIPKYIILLVIILLLVGCDQATKSIAKRELQSTSSEYFYGLVRFQLAENEGGFLSIGSTLPLAIRQSIIALLAVITVMGFILLMIFAHSLTTSHLIPLSLMAAGAIGNLIDRLFNQGRVVDFIILGTQVLHTGIFNIADVLLTCGIILLLIGQIVQRKSEAS